MQELLYTQCEIRLNLGKNCVVIDKIITSVSMMKRHKTNIYIRIFNNKGILFIC